MVVLFPALRGNVKIDAQLMLLLLLIGVGSSIISGVVYRLLSKQPVAIAANIKHALTGGALGTVMGAGVVSSFVPKLIPPGWMYYAATLAVAVAFSVYLQRMFERHPPGGEENSK